MSYGLLIPVVIWLIYTGLTIYGIAKFPAYDFTEKSQKILLALILPIYGSYLANKNMRHRFSDAARKEIAYELPWWSNITFSSSGTNPDFEDD